MTMMTYGEQITKCWVTVDDILGQLPKASAKLGMASLRVPEAARAPPYRARARVGPCSCLCPYPRPFSPRGGATSVPDSQMRLVRHATPS